MNEMVDTMFETFRNLNSDELFQDTVRITPGPQGSGACCMSEKSALPFTRRERKSKSEEQRGLSTVKKTSCVKKQDCYKTRAVRGALYEGAFQKLWISLQTP